MRHPYVALDTETTGLDVGRDELIEVAAIRFQGAEVLGTWHSLIKPAGDLPEAITRITGITPSDLERAPLFHTLLPDLARFLGDDPIVGHSVGFDREFLAAQGLPLSNPLVDTYELSTLLLSELPDRSLISVARALGIEYPEQHRALADAQVAMQVFRAFREQLAALDLALLEELVRLTSQVNWPLTPLFEEVLQQAVKEGFGRQQDARQPLAQRLVDPEPRPDPLEETADERPLDGERLAQLLSPEGLFAQAFPGYEHRPQQVDMLQAVAHTFNWGGQLIVEAGTGTGKSVAYLIPAIALGVRRGQHVVVSTNTINLQDQLFYKDIPDLQRVLAQAGPEVSDLARAQAALLKGRSNYICLRRWETLRRSQPLTLEQVSTLAKTLLWLPRTRTGDRAELALGGQEHSVWGEMAASSTACQGADCRYQQRDLCFLYRARRRAQAAHIVVANHSLLLTDVATENRVLPPYRYLVVDEAHHLEGVATDQLGFHVTADDLLAHLASISQPIGGGREEGLLAVLPAYFADKRVPTAARQTMDLLRREARSGVDAARLAAQSFFTTLQTFLQYRPEVAGSSQYDQHLRITSAVRIQPDWDTVEIAWEQVSSELRYLLERLSRIYQLCRERAEALGEDEDATAQNDLLLELALLGQNTQEIQQQVMTIVSEAPENAICWITRQVRGDTIGLHVAPLHVGHLLQDGLYQQKEAIVLTSATLSTEGTTTFLRERLGVADADELLLDSPFDFPRAALMLIPEDMPAPDDAQYGRTLSRTLVHTCRASEGRTLVLFTSHFALRQTYQAIRRALEQDNIAVLGQGLDGSRHVLLEKFRRNPRSVLLGTSSFWEGIDVVGDALSVLVITKLPFSVPSDPIFAARCELFEEPFYQYAVPQAVLRFKQGFGRLIRSKTDRGTVLMLDPRVLTRTYGSIFLDSLPPCTIRRVRSSSIPAMVRSWLSGETAGESY